MIGHIGNNGARVFKPTERGGGSRKGKPQGRWPMIYRVVASALVDRAKGSVEARIADRTFGLSVHQFKAQMERALPGCWTAAEELLPGRSTDLAKLLMNRVYKECYSGTSDRRRAHDPKTRASFSSEHWTRRVPEGHRLRDVYGSVRQGVVAEVEDWRGYLADDAVLRGRVS